MAIQLIDTVTPDIGLKTVGDKLNNNFTDPSHAASKLVLGTVSQSGGVPTGAIIQRGSNANGEFVRFADGTQICFGSTPTTTQLGGESSGVYAYSYDQRSGAFPIAFSSTPTLSVAFANAGSYSVAGLDGLTPPSNISTGRIRGASASSGITDARYIWTAIGRWY